MRRELISIWLTVQQGLRVVSIRVKTYIPLGSTWLQCQQVLLYNLNFRGLFCVWCMTANVLLVKYDSIQQNRTEVQAASGVVRDRQCRRLPRDPAYIVQTLRLDQQPVGNHYRSSAGRSRCCASVCMLIVVSVDPEPALGMCEVCGRTGPPILRGRQILDEIFLYTV